MYDMKLLSTYNVTARDAAGNATAIEDKPNGDGQYSYLLVAGAFQFPNP